jgi:hypothetical protein
MDAAEALPASGGQPAPAVLRQLMDAAEALPASGGQPAPAVLRQLMDAVEIALPASVPALRHPVAVLTVAMSPALRCQLAALVPPPCRRALLFLALPCHQLPGPEPSSTWLADWRPTWPWALRGWAAGCLRAEAMALPAWQQILAVMGKRYS